MKILHMLHELDCRVGDLGSTVRKGTKWKGSLGEGLILCVCSDRCLDYEGCNDPDMPSCDNCLRTGEARVVDEWCGKFSEIPARLIEIEHEERSRQYSGLYQSMEKAYGEEFGESSYVVVLVYERTA